jgi:hypothetical protein
MKIEKITQRRASQFALCATYHLAHEHGMCDIAGIKGDEKCVQKFSQKI